MTHIRMALLVAAPFAALAVLIFGVISHATA